MPHKCVNCGHLFEDGSKEMLDGCPDCGGSKFMFGKGEAFENDEPVDVGDESPPKPEGSDSTTIIEADDEDEKPRRFGGQFSVSESKQTEAEEPKHDVSSSGDSDADQPETIETPDTEELRQELMDQFETIKIIEPGSYELNLMNLYDKDEKIIALQEDGRYQVSLPSAFDDR